MSFQKVSERLAALQETNAQLKTLIDRLATLEFQPGSVPLGNEEGNVMTELTAEIQQTIRDQDEDFEDILEDVYGLQPGRPGSELMEQRNGLEIAVKRARKDLMTYQTEYRRAVITAKRTLTAAQRQERALLLQSYSEPRSSTSSPLPGRPRRVQQTKELTQEEKTLNASSDVTLALRRTHDMMASELSRSQFAHDTLKESNAALEALSETYSTLDTMLSSSKNLLGTLLRSQKSDTWYLETAFYILLATIAWLFWRRILYGPTWWLVWFPLKIFFRSGMGVLGALGLRGGSREGVTAISSSIAASSISAASIAASSVVHSKATRPSKVPGGNPSSVNVGGGGRGAPMSGSNVPGGNQGSPDSVSEQVGRIIDESQKGGFVEGEEEIEGEAEESEEQDKTQPNPKKRMWEEDKEASKEAQRLRDEL